VGDTLKLHQALAGGKTRASVRCEPEDGLAGGPQVDADALPGQLKSQIRAGRSSRRSGDDARAPQAQRRGRRDGHFATAPATSSRWACNGALCHSTVDDSFAPGWQAPGRLGEPCPERRRDRSLAPNLTPIADLLQVDVATVKAVLNSWGPGRFDAILDKDGKAFRPTAGRRGR